MEKIKELKKKITDLEKDNVEFKDANQVKRASEASLKSLVVSKDKDITGLKNEMVMQVEQFTAREVKIKTATIT